MIMTKLILAAALAFSVSAGMTKAAHASWETNFYIDDVNSIEIYTARSAFSSPEVLMEEPYKRTSSQLFYTCTDGIEDLGILFTDKPNIINGDIKEGVDEYFVAVRWNNEDWEKVRLTHRWNSFVAFFPNPDEYIERLKSSSKLNLRVEWFRNGFPTFSYDLTGGGEVVEEAQSRCGIST